VRRSARRYAGAAIVTVVVFAGCAGDTYRQPEQRAGGSVRLTTSRGHVVTIAPDSGQVGTEQFAVAPGNRMVGWLALYPNCCTSYPIPLQLVLVPIGHRRIVLQGDLPIWQWAFVDGGRHVALRQSPVHGASVEHYALYDATTGRLLASADVEDGGSKSPPRWAQPVAAPPKSGSPFD
jgi:hypothetical protein